MRETLPPYNLDAEESVLGSILIDPDCISVLKVYTEDFFSEQNQFVFGAMKNLDARKIPANEITVAQELVNLGKLDDAGGASYLAHLVAHCPTSLHAEYYAKIVRDCATNRRWISAAGQIENIGYKNLEPKESDEQIQKIIRGISTSIEDDSLITPKEWADKGADRYAKLSKGLKSSVHTGIQQLDYETGGLFQGEMWVLGGGTGQGKSTLAMQIAENMQLEGNVLIASLEMNWRGLLDRSIASKLSKHPRSIRVGNYSDEFYKEIFDMLPIIAETNIYLLGKGLTVGANISVETIYNVAYKMKVRHGLVAIIVDYLQLISDKNRTATERATSISTDLKRIVEALEVPGLILSQFHRPDEKKKDTRPSMHDFRDCVAKDTKVLMASGKLKPVTEINDDIMVYDAQTNQYTKQRADILYAGTKNIYRVTTQLGFEIDCSDGHRFLTYSKYKPLKKLSIGEYITIAGTKLWQDRIISIKSIGRQEAYDLHVPIYHNYIANGFIVHNSGMVESNADGILLMYRPDKYPKIIEECPELRGTAELIMPKNRYGDSDITIPLMWNNERRIYE
jgi:replicative DNA helicase